MNFTDIFKGKGKNASESATVPPAHAISKCRPYNVGSVLWRLFSTSGDNISTVEVAQYSGG